MIKKIESSLKDKEGSLSTRAVSAPASRERTRQIYTSTSDEVERVTDGNTDKAGMAEDVVQVDGDDP